MLGEGLHSCPVTKADHRSPFDRIAWRRLSWLSPPNKFGCGVQSCRTRSHTNAYRETALTLALAIVKAEEQPGKKTNCNRPGVTLGEIVVHAQDGGQVRHFAETVFLSLCKFLDLSNFVCGLEVFGSATFSCSFVGYMYRVPEWILSLLEIRPLFGDKCMHGACSPLAATKAANCLILVALEETSNKMENVSNCREFFSNSQIEAEPLSHPWFSRYGARAVSPWGLKYLLVFLKAQY